MGKRELVALLYLSSWCLVMVERLFLAVQQGCLRFVIEVFPYHTYLLFLLTRAHSRTVELTDLVRDEKEKMTKYVVCLLLQIVVKAVTAKLLG